MPIIAQRLCDVLQTVNEGKPSTGDFEWQKGAFPRNHDENEAVNCVHLGNSQLENEKNLGHSMNTRQRTQQCLTYRCYDISMHKAALGLKNSLLSTLC